MNNKTLSPADIQQIFDASPFIASMGMHVESADLAEGKLTVRVPMKPEFERRKDSGQWHGGPIASVIDTVGDLAVGMLVGRGLPTINFRVDYFRPAVQTALIVVATVRRNGRSVGVADVDVYNEDNVLLAIGRATYATTTA